MATSNFFYFVPAMFSASHTQVSQTPVSSELPVTSQPLAISVSLVSWRNQKALSAKILSCLSIFAPYYLGTTGHKHNQQYDGMA